MGVLYRVFVLVQMLNDAYAMLHATYVVFCLLIHINTHPHVCIYVHTSQHTHIHTKTHTQDAEFVQIMVPLFKRISLCLNSQHFQVAERSLFLWNNEYINSLVAHHRQNVLPLIFPALERNARSHWNAAVHGLTCNVRKMFMELDPGLYEQCRKQFEEDEVCCCDGGGGGAHTCAYCCYFCCCCCAHVCT